MFYIIIDLLIGCIAIHKIVKEANTKLPTKELSEKWYFAVRYIYLAIFLVFAISRFLRHVLVAIQNQLLIASWIILTVGVILFIARLFVPHKVEIHHLSKNDIKDVENKFKMLKDSNKHQEQDIPKKTNVEMHNDNMKLSEMASKLESINWFYMQLFIGKPLNKIALLDLENNPKLKKAINVLGSHYNFDINDYIKAEKSALNGKPDKLNDIKNSIQANPLSKAEQSADIKKVSDYVKQLNNSNKNNN